MRADATTEASDAELVAALRAGDSAALAAIYDRHGAALHAFAVRTLGSPHDAADACQDAFVLAFQRIDQLRDPARLRPWLYAIVRNECTRIGRARDRVVPVGTGGRDENDSGTASAAAAAAMTGAGPTTAARAPTGDDPVGALAVRNDDAAVLGAALAGLDARDRSLFALQAVEGLAGRDLADAAGIPARQLGQATARMRDRLERSIVALLVSRHGRRDCPELGAILSAWDGHLTVLLRKRVSRHIDDCATCTSRRAALVLPIRSALAAPLPLVVAPEDLRDRVLQRVASVGDGVTTPGPAGPDERWPGGFPPRPPRDRGTRADRALAAAAVVLGMLVVVAVLLGSAGGARVETVAAPATTTTTAVPTTAPTTTTAPAPAPPTTAAPPTTEAPGEAEPPGPTSPEPTGSTTEPVAEVPDPPDPVTDPPPPPPEEEPDPLPPAPEVEVVRTPPPLVRTGCPGPTEGLVAATATGTGLVVELLTEGIGGARTTAMTASGGGWRGSIGPFAEPGTLTGQVRATDAEGRTATSAPFTVEVRPCAG